MSEPIDKIKAVELIQLAIDDCDNWEDWDTSDRSNFENMGTNLEKVQAHLTDKAKVLDQALSMLSICFNQATEISSNESIYDDLNGKDIPVKLVKAFLEQHYASN